jgi:hypothetical protein
VRNRALHAGQPDGAGCSLFGLSFIDAWRQGLVLNGVVFTLGAALTDPLATLPRQMPADAPSPIKPIGTHKIAFTVATTKKG